MAGYDKPANRGKGNHQEAGRNRDAASASIIGEPFHNPYTFIPFPKEVKRFFPTGLTADELPAKTERQRQSGILELEIRTLSPLMTCRPVPDPESKDKEHKTYSALTIGNDVVVPATGIRGTLRTLMTIISGGTLGYMDEDLWLTQGRDAQLGPSKKDPNVPDQAFLAQVIEPGTATRPGILLLGEEPPLIRAEQLLGHRHVSDRRRPTSGNRPFEYKDPSGKIWKVKLSGRPVGSGQKLKNKKEGLFRSNGQTLTLSEKFWTDYQGRNRHSYQKELRKDDLVWLQPMHKDCKKITLETDVKSIQWARWGRQGESFKSMVPDCVLPDSMRGDGGVDMVTDLFGQIPHPKVKGAAGPFAARIRPGNLIFQDARDRVFTETLAPLAPPHPGCLAFYRDGEDLDELNSKSPLKGYKVYRNTLERGDNAPWKYTVQGVYKEKGALKTPYTRKVNKTVGLLEEGMTGKLRISFRALDPRERALLFAACSVDWKIGGGKPLGLGHCRVTGIKMIDEDGNVIVPMEMSENGDNLVLKDTDQKQVAEWKDRIELYRVSQVPVEKLRYPRVVTQNQNQSRRGGFAWFARHASPKKTGKRGLETIWTRGELQKKAGASQIKAQALPRLDPKNPAADLLYGYDMVELDVDGSRRNQRLVGKMEKFDPKVHARNEEKPGENRSQNRESRKRARSERS